MTWEKGDDAVRVCGALFVGQAKMSPCFSAIIDAIGWRWGVLIFGYLWLSFLVVLQSMMVRAGCGKLQSAERSMAGKTVMEHTWHAFMYINVILAPKDVREWGFWLLWFSSTGLLILTQNIVKEHLEHVVDNPRYGVMHTLRALSLHVLIIFVGFHLAMFGWGEFYQWGQGPVGRIMLSSRYPDGGHGGGVQESGSATDPERGGAGFAVVLMYELAVMATEVLLSALKYLGNLYELSRGPSTAYSTEGSMEHITFIVRLGQAILSTGRNLYIFQACKPCSLTRKTVTRIITVFNGIYALDQIHRAAWRVVLAREMDMAFPDASEKDLKNMASDEACAICLKVMTVAKRLECEHFFHSGCLRQYLNNSAGSEPLCPICRATIPWHPSARIKPKRTNHIHHNTTDASRNHNHNRGNADRYISPTPRLHHPPLDHALGLSPGGDSMPTPDSFTRAARGADAAVRFLRRIAQAFGSEVDMVAATVGGTPTVTPPGVGGGGTTREGPPGRETRATTTPTTAASTAYRADEIRLSEGASGVDEIRGAGTGTGSIPGGLVTGSPAIETVAQQLVEIFPDMERQTALARALLARGSLERAVELALVPTATPVAERRAGDGSGGSGVMSGSARREGTSLVSPGSSTLRRRWWS